LRGWRTPVGVLELICRAFFDPNDRAQFSGRIDELFYRAHDQARPSETIPDSVVMPKRRDGLSMRIAKRRGVVRVEIAEEHDRSLVIWTLYGYAYALTHGGEIPVRVRFGETCKDATLRRAVVARVFADWFDATHEGQRSDWRPDEEAGLAESERRELRAAMRDAEMIRGLVGLILAAFGGEARRDGRVRARPMDGVR